MLFDFEAGGRLKDHATDGYVTVLVLGGEIRMATAEEQHQMSSGALLVLRPGMRHDLEANVACSVLLAVRLDPSEDDRPLLGRSGVRRAQVERLGTWDAP